MKRASALIAWIILLLWSAPSIEESGETAFAKVVKKTSSLKDCVVTYEQYSSRGKNQELYSLRTVEGKYIRSPRLYYHKLIETEYNYKEQAQQGFQEIYRGDTAMTEMLLPGALRMLGVVKIFPEDPKATAMRGENLKTLAPWDIMNQISEMARTGKTSLRTEAMKGKKYLLFEITQDPGTYYNYGINRVIVYADPETFLPIRIEKYAPNQTRPVAWFEYSQFKIDTGITPDQIKFEGIKGPFSLLNPASGAEIEGLIKPVERTPLKEPAADVNTIISEFQEAVAKTEDYRADMSMRFRYGRLRLYREDRFAYHRDPYWFTLITDKQKANYFLLSHSANSVVWFDPEDECFHITGGGVQRLLGEQVFQGKDYKFYSTLGDNPYELDFSKILAMIRQSFINSKASSRLVEYKGDKMCELVLVRTGKTPPRHPGRINLVLDLESHLPRIVELSGYDDPHALMAMTVDNIQINLGLKPRQFKF